MPFAKLKDINMYYEEAGTGTPVVFLAGLGGTRKIWYKQMAFLKNHFRVILPDNRGAGDTDKPEGPYSMDMLANDLNGLLDFLGIKEPVYLAGASFGGVIAQNFIHQYPQRVKKLVLACTTLPFGDPYCVPIQEHIAVKVLMINQPSSENKRKIMSDIFFHPETIEKHPEIVDELLSLGIGEQPEHAKKAQSMAYLIKDSKYHQWLSEIKVPVLVVQGNDDLIIQKQNAENLKKLIGDKAELYYVEKGGHLFFIERHEVFNQKLLEFFTK